MINEEQLILVRWSNRIAKHYLELGYKKLKHGESFEVPAKHLPQKSNAMVEILCDVCQKEKYFISYHHYNDKKSEIDICKSCFSSIDYECDYCKSPIKIERGLLKRYSHHFCGNDCRYAYFKGNNIHNYKEKVTLNCNYCNEKIETEQRIQEELISGNRKNIFCNQECKGKWESENIKGKNHHLYTERINKTCQICDKSYEVLPSQSKRTKYCSRECAMKAMNSEPISHIRWLTLNKNKTNTKPQQIVNEILNNLSIKYENEFLIKYYSIDNYLSEYNLMIEVMGDYWHSGFTRFKNFEELGETQLNNLRTDKAKNTYVKNKFNINILYLWENDIVNNKLLIEELIKFYINKNGEIENYHSFNYSISNGNLIINEDIITPYFLQQKMIVI